MRTRWMTTAVVTVAVLGGMLAGCGSDDSEDAAEEPAAEEPAAPAGEAADSGDRSTVDSSEDSAPSSTEQLDELVLADPCEVVPDTKVAEIVGANTTGQLVNVDDGLPGATCTYIIAANGTISLSITPDGADFYSTYRGEAEADEPDEVVDLGDVGDEAYIFQGMQVDAITGDVWVQVQVLTSATTADTGGVEIVDAAIDAIG